MGAESDGQRDCDGRGYERTGLFGLGGADGEDLCLPHEGEAGEERPAFLVCGLVRQHEKPVVSLPAQCLFQILFQLA